VPTDTPTFAHGLEIFTETHYLYKDVNVC